MAASPSLLELRAFHKRESLNARRFRVVHLPDRTWEILGHYFPKAAVGQGDPGLAFTYRGHQLASSFIPQRFHAGLENAGIPSEGRRLTPHSLRFTYDTKMQALLPSDVLREYIGYRSEQRTDHHDRATQRPVLETRIAQLEGQRPAVERFRDNGRATS